MKKEELTKEVDENDKVIGVRPRSDFHDGGYIHRTSHLIIKSPEGNHLLQKRAKSKKWYPGLYSFAASGTVGDESYEECIVREAKEELGLDVSVKPLFKFKFKDLLDGAWQKVFIVEINEDQYIKFLEDEVESIIWLPEKNLLNSINSEPEKYAPGFLKGMPMYFEK